MVLGTVSRCCFNDHSFVQDEVQEKVSVVNSISDRINVLERKLEVRMYTCSYGILSRSYVGKNACTLGVD